MLQGLLYALLDSSLGLNLGLANTPECCRRRAVCEVEVKWVHQLDLQFVKDRIEFGEVHIRSVGLCALEGLKLRQGSASHLEAEGVPQIFECSPRP